MPADVLIYGPIALLLMIASGFFSGSEAAYFSLSMAQRGSLAKSKLAADRVAVALLSDSERLLMGVLFWNLIINLSYFALVSHVTILLGQQRPDSGPLLASIAFGALLAIILFGEFLPKSVAVSYPLVIARLVAIPLALAIRALSLIMPVLELITEASRRLLWPGLQPEPYLSAADLNRVVTLSAGEDSLMDTESQVLQNIIQLKEIRAEEWMRPRTQYLTFSPPIDWAQLGSQLTPSGYMLVTSRQGGEIVGYVDLRNLAPRDFTSLAAQQKLVLVVPWCTNIADTLQRLCKTNRRVAVIVNEYGESVGVLTWEDIFDAILQLQHGRTQRELARAEIRKIGQSRWLVTGTTKVRRLQRAMGRDLGEAHNLTVGGIVQERLRRIPEPGDVCQLGEVRLEVLEAGPRGQLLIEIAVQPAGEATP